tara:strand:- start:333 stop:1559 length:1227 start_codon:yes stop_codon:yes gene_type:complete
MIFHLNEYADITKLVNDKDYANSKNIKVKKVTINEKYLYMLNYDKSKLNEENMKTLGMFRSVITNGEKIICFSTPKSLRYLNFVSECNYEETIVEDFVEGTMINLFYYNNEWMCSTKGTIGAKCKFFRDYPKTYRVLFLEAMEKSNLEFDMLNKNYSYSFVLQHPENRIVVPFSEMKLVLVALYECNEFDVTEKDVTLAFPGFDGSDETGPKVYLPSKINEIYPNFNKKSFGELFDYFTSLNLSYKTMGVILKSGGNRTKIWNPNYLKVKHLRGNNPKIQFQYYHLLKDKKLMEFLSYYPEYKELFDTFKLDLYNWTEQLWKNYKSCYIRKEAPLKTFPGQFRTHMFNVHQKYINEIKPINGRTDKLTIINYVNSLEPAQLMYSVNFIFREVKVDECKKNYDMLQQTC